jgi:YegS/Rv2252/BmrU family lipid kinase
MKKVLFIINSLLQKRSGKDLLQIIPKYLDKSKFDFDICYSLYAGHAAELAFSRRDEYDIMVAAGGDGTLNEVGQALAGTVTILGLIPLGSGNGLSRTLLKMPPSVPKSIQIINAYNIRNLDMGLINGKPFFNMAGVGFDAIVAHRYNLKDKRGFFTYLQTVIKLFFNYQSRKFEVLYDSEVHTIKAFLISFANTSQWGYNAHVCPGADPSDGLLGITIIQSFPKYIVPFLAWRLFTKKINKSRFVKVFMTKNIQVRSPGEIIGHVDGNPVIFRDNISVEVVHNAIKVITA